MDYKPKTNKMKTALQELIEWMEQKQYFIGNDLYAKQKELLEKEKEQIKEAYKFGLESPSIDLSEEWAEEYYNDNYNQNK
jgi:hypothetical protein